jgi:hypothetical protein
VSETEEELYSDEDVTAAKDKNRKKKIKVFSLGYFSQLMNKKIYSDDFDMASSDRFILRRQRENAGSLMEYPISEDNVESEEDNVADYLSDYSGSGGSTFSFKKKMSSFDLSRFIDRLEPQFDDSGSSLLGGGSKHYYSNVNETIEEEDDEEVLAPRSASEIYSKLKAQHDRSGSFKFL